MSHTNNHPDKLHTEIFIMYDIACSLYKYMQVCCNYLSYILKIISSFQHHGKKAILDNIHLCLPIFHCYGHKASCQVFGVCMFSQGVIVLFDLRLGLVL